MHKLTFKRKTHKVGEDIDLDFAHLDFESKDDTQVLFRVYVVPPAGHGPPKWVPISEGVDSFKNVKKIKSYTFKEPGHHSFSLVGFDPDGDGEHKFVTCVCEEIHVA